MITVYFTKQLDGGSISVIKLHIINYHDNDNLYQLHFLLVSRYMGACPGANYETSLPHAILHRTTNEAPSNSVSLTPTSANLRILILIYQFHVGPTS